MKYYFIIGIIIGVILIIYSIKELLKLKNYQKMEGLILGRHSVMGRDDYVSRIQLNINGADIEKDLDCYSIFFRKGKKINVYYNSNKNTIDCVHGKIFTLLLGIIFIIISIYLIVTL